MLGAVNPLSRSIVLINSLIRITASLNMPCWGCGFLCFMLLPLGSLALFSSTLAKGHMMTGVESDLSRDQSTDHNLLRFFRVSYASSAVA